MIRWCNYSSGRYCASKAAGAKETNEGKKSLFSRITQQRCYPAWELYIQLCVELITQQPRKNCTN